MAKDKYHDLVRTLLEEEGWTITDDPLVVKTEFAKLRIDLAAEKLLGAEKDGQKIAVEIKSFIGHSKLNDLYGALGKFVLYLPALEEAEPSRVLYLALPEHAYDYFYQDSIAEKIVKRNDIKFILYDPDLKKIIAWK